MIDWKLIVCRLVAQFSLAGYLLLSTQDSAESDVDREKDKRERENEKERSRQRSESKHKSPPKKRPGKDSVSWFGFMYLFYSWGEEVVFCRYSFADPNVQIV